VTAATNMPSNGEISETTTSEIPLDLVERLNASTNDVLELIASRLPPESETLEPARHTLASGGKHVRVRLTLLSAFAAELDMESSSALAAIAEMVHTATLIHDDVIDGGDERRGQVAAHIVHGNKHAILGGDLLLIEALRLAHTTATPNVTTDLMKIIHAMVEGEYLQMKAQHVLPAHRETALAINHGKTAQLFGWCMAAPWMMAGSKDRVVDDAREFGEQMGSIFQRMDDLLDLVGRPHELGKPGLLDLRDGKITLALAEILESAPLGVERVQRIWEMEAEGADVAEELVSFRKWVKGLPITDGLRTMVKSDTERALALLETLTPCPARDAIASITRKLVQRSR